MMTHLKRLILAATFLAASTAAAGVITDVRFQSTGAAQVSVPVTFGQVFAVGDMKKSDVLVGKLDGAALPLQVDVKATHADGSVRHAIISAIVPKLAAGATGTMTLATGGTLISEGTKTPADLLAAGFTASASATIAGVKYSASADQLMKGATSTWLAGAVANEWQVSAPLTTAAGVAHPHLQARFAVRYYSAVKKARVDVTIENDWAYEPGPQNFIYDAEILVGGKSVYTKAGLNHLHHARWRKLFWWGDAPAVNVQSNVPYLISTRAVPNYDQSVQPAEKVLIYYGATKSEPMGLGVATPYMPTTGAHDDIGILPAWQAAYVLSMDDRARLATMLTADGAGSWSMHYRDKVTDRPVSLSSFPRMTIVGNLGDAYNYDAKRSEYFPIPAGDITTPYTHDTAHQPSLAYLPYLLTGDYFYLEEVQFWAMYDTFMSNPNYRGNGQGLVTWDQLRGQGWSLRTLAQAAYATPDADALKVDLVTLLNNNFDWYNAAYSNNPDANKLGVPIQGYSIAYTNDTAIATWMDDFFTSAVGHAVDLGFAKVKPLLDWKAKFPVGRMTAPGVCWMVGAPYSLTIRDSNTSPVYSTLAQAYTHDFGADFMALPCAGAAMAAKWNAKVGDMGNIPDSYAGYPSNMQPALAYSVDSGIEGSKAAWILFANRAVKPNYSLGAQFNIVPRGFAAVVTTPPPPIVDAPAAPAVPVDVAALVAAPTAAGTWSKIGMEHSTITVAADTIVRYGDAGKYAYAKISGTFTAENDFFGGDPAPTITKTVESFTPSTAPVAKPGKVTTPTNVKLQKLTGLTATFIDPVSLDEAKVVTGVAATAKGAFSVTDAALVPGATYIVRVASAGGVLDVMYPITAQ